MRIRPWRPCAFVRATKIGRWEAVREDEARCRDNLHRTRALPSVAPPDKIRRAPGWSKIIRLSLRSESLGAARWSGVRGRKYRVLFLLRAQTDELREA